MGCSNARLLVQAPLTGEAGAGTTNPPVSQSTNATSPGTFANDSTTRMHLTGVDLVVERNGSYTLLLTPKTHKQLMPYVLRKKRFRILVDKPRSDPTLTSNEPVMMENNNNKESTKKNKSIEQIASDEYERVQSRFVGGRSIDRGNPEDDEELIQSDDEGMIEEIVTTIEQDKDLECKVKKKIETKKTIAQHPQTHSTITKVVKTEVTEITRTITINDHHDLERAKRELGIDDVNRLLPSATWIDSTKRSAQTTNETITSKDLAKEKTNNSIKQTHPDEKPILAQSTVVGRGPVVETISPIENKKEKKKKQKKSKFCSCTRAVDDEQDKPPTEPTKSPSVAAAPVVVSTPPPVTTDAPVVKSIVETQIQGQTLISFDLKQLIIDKKSLLIEYIHSKIFTPTNLFHSTEEDNKGRKMSSRILDLLRYDRCSSWKQMSEQLTEEYAGNSIANRVLQPMINTYENLFTTKQANLLNTFATIHHENDLQDIQENHAYLNIAQTHIHHQPIESTTIDITIPETIQLEQAPPTKDDDNDDDDQLTKGVDMSEEIPEIQPVYNEEYLGKMLAEISPHKPITLAEAIAYQYFDIEDPKLGLSNEIIQRLKSLFRPLSDSNVSNAIRIKRSGEYLTDLDLSQSNSFEQFTDTEPWIYQLQSTFEPTLDFNEKQFRTLTETLTKNEKQFDQLEFDIARTSLPIYDLKESSTNDFSQSDSGYSMTTATHESLASKIKIEFEPINQDSESIPMKREDFDTDEKIDLDKATQEQLDKYELSPDLIQIIKSDFNGTDKTIGQAILSRELRLDTTTPHEIEHLKSLGIGDEQIRILTAFFFPKQTRIIAYSPEPGRFVEAQTTYNPDYPGYKTDTTIIQIQEKQLSSDELAMQRNLHEDRPIVQPITTESEQIVSATVTKPKAPSPVQVKKRKSTGTGGLLSCFKSKKPKSGTEQQGQPTVVVTEVITTQETSKPIEEKVTVDFSILPDGRRIYIDAFRDRPGLDMSYKPQDFDNRFVLPVAKPASEYERPITPEIAPRVIQKQQQEEAPIQIEDASITHVNIESAPPTIIEHKPEIHLQPRPATIEPVDVQPDTTPAVVISSAKSEVKTAGKKSLTIDLHGAAVDLPDIELVTPGPLPTLSTIKVKKSTGGLCASCFGAKSAEKTKKKSIPKSIQAPIEAPKPAEKEEEKRDLSPIIEVPSMPSNAGDEPILPRVNIDQFRERNFEKHTGTLLKSGDQSVSPTEKPTSVTESPQPVTPSEPTSAPITDTSIFSRVNIDTFKERTFQKGSEYRPQPQEPLQTTVATSPPPIVEEPLYQSPTNQPVSPSPATPPSTSPIAKDTNIFSQVNIDTFKERNFQKGSENLPKSEEQLDTTNEIVTLTDFKEPAYQSPTNESIPPSPPAATSVQPITKDTSLFSQVNIDTFKERTFEKSSESLPKSKERLDSTNETATPLAIVEEPHYQLPTNEPVTPPFPTSQSMEQIIKDTSVYSQVNIDTFRERTLPKHSDSVKKKAEEPHYELPSNEPIPAVSLENAYASAEYNTYDTPRTVEVEQTPSSSQKKTEEKIIKYDTNMTSRTSASDIQKSSGDFVSTEVGKEVSKMIEVSPKTEVKEKKIKKKKSKETKPKSEKKSRLLSTLFCHRDHQSTVPALDLPAVERELSPNNPLRPPHRHDSDPLRIPSIGLPKLDLPLPTYDRPEVNMTTGYTKQSSEFTIPVVDFPPIPDLQLPKDTKQTIHISHEEQMKIPHVQLPTLQFTQTQQEKVLSSDVSSKIKTEPTTIETGLALSSPIDDLLSIQTDRKNFPIETDYAIKTETINSILTTQITTISSSTSDQQITVIDTHYVETSEVPLSIEKQTSASPQLEFQLPSTEPIPTLSKTSKSIPPSFDDDVRSPPSKIVPAVTSTEKTPIETKTETKKKSSTLSFCSCFGDKSTASKGKSQTLTAPGASLPAVDMPVPSSNISTTLKSKGPLRAPGNDLPAVDFTGASIDSTRLPSIHLQEKQGQTNDAVVPSMDVKSQSLSSSFPPAAEQKIKSEISASTSTKQPIEEIRIVSSSKKSPSFDIKAPIIDVPPVHLPAPNISLSHQTATSSETIQTQSDSGLDQITSSHIQASSTLGEIPQLPSLSSGFGSEILESMTTKGYSLPDIELPEPTLVPKYSSKSDLTRQINPNHEIRTKFIARQNDIKTALATEIPKSLDQFNATTDSSTLDKILTNSIDLIKDKKVSTYAELHDKLHVEHQQQIHLINPVVHSLYYIMENHGLDNLDKPEFPLTIRDMAHLPAKQTSDTVTHLNKESASLTTSLMTKEILPDSARSCLTCGRSKSKTKHPPATTVASDLLDERRRTQLQTHRTELTNILRDHIQLSQPAIRQFAEHPKEVEKILRKTLTSLTQPKTTLSYEQMRHNFKGEFKQTFYLVDPIVDITRDTLDHCDITQMNERTNLDILDSNISQTANHYNHQLHLVTPDEQKALQTNQLTWLETYLINNESKEKKLTRKQNKELKKILHRTLEILSLNLVPTWDELALQLQREYSKAHDLCQRAIELIKQSQREGLFHLQQAPSLDKRRPSSLITDRARQNLKNNRNQIILAFKNFWNKHQPSTIDDEHLTGYLKKIFHYLEEQKTGQLRSYDDLKIQLKKDFPQSQHEKFLEQIVDIIEQAHATNQFDDIDKSEVQSLMKDRLDGKPLIIKEVYVSLPPRLGAYGDESLRYSSVTTNGDRTTTSHRIARGLSWREANERARILFYRGKHPAIHYDEQAAAFDVRMLLETASGGTQEIPVTDSDVHELLNSCGVQWDGVNIISLVDHSEDVVRAAEQAALKVIREKGLVDIRTPPSTRNNEEINNSMTESAD